MSVASSSLREEPPAEKKGKKARGKLIDGLLVLAFIVGLLVLLYPSIADYYNSLRQAEQSPPTMQRWPR